MLTGGRWFSSAIYRCSILTDVFMDGVNAKHMLSHSIQTKRLAISAGRKRTCYTVNNPNKLLVVFILLQHPTTFINLGLGYGPLVKLIFKLVGYKTVLDIIQDLTRNVPAFEIVIP